MYAEDSDNGRIRQISSKRSEQLFKEMTIDLVNGRARYISLDNMIKILKEFKTVEFSSKDFEPAQEMILKEVAFRMLKQHYIPRIGDKIKVGKIQMEFQRDAGAYPTEIETSYATITLPLEAATVKENNELKTIYWSNMVMQISNAIEKLWLERIEVSGLPSVDPLKKREMLEAVSILRSRYIQKDIKEAYNKAPNPLADAAIQRLERWLEEGAVEVEALPFLCEMMIQYIILSCRRQTSEIVTDIEQIKNMDGLKIALRCRIKDATEVFARHNPQDYGVLAMFQSLLNDISTRLPITKEYNRDTPSPDGIGEPTQSA